MKFLITGATGLIGNEILKECEKQYITVHFLTTSKSKLNTINNAQGFYWNPATNEMDIQAFEGVTHIIHLAGATVAKRWTKAYKKQILDSRIDTSNLLFKTLSEIEHQVSHFISASGVGVYPNSQTQIYTEQATQKSTSFLGKVVQQWEQVADQFEKLNIKITKLRIGLVLSNRGGALPKMVAPVKFGLGAAFGNGKQWQSWIHVSDLAKIFVYAAQNNVFGIVNAVAPNPVSQQKLIQTCANRLEKPLFMPNIPNFMLNIMFGEMGSILISSQHVSAQKIQDQGFQFQYKTIEEAIDEILK